MSQLPDGFRLKCEHHSASRFALAERCAKQLCPSQKKNEASASFFFYPIRRIGMASTRPARCMELRRSRVWHRAKRVLNLVLLRIDAIHHFVMIPYGTSCQFHAATGCGFHTRLWRDLARSLAISTILCYTKHRKAVD